MTPDQAREQQQQVIDDQPDLFVSACPGAGKTRTVVDRFLRVAHTVGHVAVLSFTNKAADEITQRCSSQGVPELVGFPNFVGTFDRFLATFVVRPFGRLGGPIQIVESWESLGAVVRARGLRGEISLDHFEISPDGVMRFEPHHGAPRLDEQFRERVERIAEHRRRELRAKGYLTCDDAKEYALRLLRDHQVIARLLGHRFAEIVVDEAQDCSVTELLILEALHNAGVPLVVVADPSQAIYGWRDADVEQLESLAERLEPRVLTGNWRSSAKICALAATLRHGPPDHAIADPNDGGEPVHVLCYSSWPDPTIGQEFVELVDSYGISRSESVVLAHAEATAARVVGASVNRTSSVLASFARAGQRLRDPGLSPVERQRELYAVERLLLHFVGAETEGWTTRDAVTRSGVDDSWLRLAAMEVINTMAPLDIDSDCDSWTEALRRCLSRIGAPRPLKAKSPNVFLKTPPSAKGHSVASLIGVTSRLPVRFSTIHAAKGSEADAVLTVIARDRGTGSRTADLIDAWKNGRHFEPLRVLFVAITRARRLSVLAVPQAHGGDVRAILTANGISPEVRQL